MICRLPRSPKRAPPLLFVHGAWHGAWCWDEHFLGFFAEHGFASYALDLRGRGDNVAGKSLKRVRIRDFVDDIAAAVEHMPSPPILVGHSLGGFVVQKYLETASAPLAFLLASVPPWGGRRIFLRSLLRDPLSAILGNVTLSLFPPVSTPRKAKAVLFSPSMSEAEAARHQARLQDEALLAYLESLAFVRVRPELVSTPIVVLGGAEDAMVERSEVVGTASAFGVRAEIFDGLAHDIMLDPNWRLAAQHMLAEIDSRLSLPRDERRLSAAAA